ncbi:HTH-type transcriptional regulator GltR [Vibrio stylophorae]|jgi:DNA-binding transcriptional LysR family regulator|uniref:HTH-type transcriptional regulator GltR n=1 Tax=Vibrio stylophorae TaxID=659351 RepID=A0ABN8DQM3_9VIBR|nr:LysR family transcriptional regulator [Vibrio stylophorae]CAH0532922.1 HTH-type transcriptional regulator GltR [Vibrio stylophorae]
MDVKVFRTFLEVAKERHFGHAADNLYITQAAVSARIKQLESYFDAALFRRHRNNITLTSAGERLVPYAEMMVTTLQQAKFELALEEHKAYQLTLGGTPNVWDAFLQHGLSVVTDAFDGYGFIAESLSREHLQRKLHDRTLDMAFSFEPMKADEFHCEALTDLTLMLVSTEPRTIEEAFANHYIYIDWGEAFSRAHALRHPQVAVPYMRTSTGRIALDFILEKGGAAYLPASLAAPFIASGQLFAVSDVEPWPRPIYLSYRKNSAALEAIEQVRTLLKALPPATAYLLQQASEAAATHDES